MKELSKANLDLENEKIRKRREEKKQKEEGVKLQTQLEGLQGKLDGTIPDSDDKTADLQDELDRKQRRLKNVQNLIRELKSKTMKKRDKSLKANRMVDDINDAIDNIRLPEGPVYSKPVSRTHIYNEPISEEEIKIPIATRIEDIFDFASQEIKKVSSEKHKAQLEYRLISGLKNNLHKENVNWKQHMTKSLFATRKSIADIHSKIECQSYALESEK